MEESYQERQARKNELFFEKNLPKEFLNAVEVVKPQTMLSVPAMFNAWQVVKFIAARGIPGSIVECGTWQGGCLELMAIARDSEGGLNQIIGVDTFDGHPPPDHSETDVWGRNQREIYEDQKRQGQKWAYANFDTVSQRLSKFKELQLIQGLVEEVAHLIPRPIAFLRLDMDWYRPTIFSLKNLVPHVVPGGVITIDDYGAHSGCRAAVDEWLETQSDQPLIHHVDYSTRTFQVNLSQS
jgi:hypothetical protein